MALLFIDSFDHYATADLTEKWTTEKAGSVATIGAYGRRGTSGFRATSGNDQVLVGLTSGSPTEWIMGAAVCFNSLATATSFMAMYDGVGDRPQVQLRVNVDGSISAVRGPAAAWMSASSLTVLGTSAPAVVSAGVFAYIEFAATIDNAAGTVDVRVDGISVLSLTGQDTQVSANANATGVVIGSTGTEDTDFDDVYVCDTTGGANDDFLGDMRVDALLPNGAGATTGWTASAGNNYACVDDTAPNDDTDYVSTDTVNAVDTYAFPNLPNAGGAIQGLQVLVSCKKEDAGACSIAPVVRPVATDRVGTTVAVGTTYAYHARQCYDTSPETGIAWTESEFNGSEFGVKKIV